MAKVPRYQGNCYLLEWSICGDESGRKQTWKTLSVLLKSQTFSYIQ